MEEDSQASTTAAAVAASELRLHSSNVEERRAIYGAEQVKVPISDAGAFPGVGSISGARYKLMSPAKLPISRSPCLTIPPGLSPTSLLESPVLLSNIKAEPSPTTGSFFKAQLMQSSCGGAAFTMTTNCSNSNTCEEKRSEGFEFKFPTLTNNGSSLLPTRPVVSTGFNQRQSEIHKLIQDQHQSQSFPSAGSVKRETSASSKNLGPSGPASEVDSDKLNQTQISDSDHKDHGPSVVAERSSDDGYNWRKYGQKVVKGSEFPRSYYKCTYPNCEVKKIFERAPDGQITEIVYKGSHDHPKPQPSRRFTTGALVSIQEERNDHALSLTGEEDKSGNNSQTCSVDPNGSPMISPQQATDSIDGPVSQLNGINNEFDEDGPFSKRRKTDMCSVDVMQVVKPIREPRVVVQTVSEVDILDDGYRWRKYGQKVVRGNPNPRSYYKCTNPGCPVRKHVERASHDPKAVITTYEGKHNHDVPTAKNSIHDTAGPTLTSRTRPEENDSITLDLGVGIQPQQTLDSGSPSHLQGQMRQLTNSNLKLVQSYGNSFETQSLHRSSNQYPQNIGRILLGP